MTSLPHPSKPANVSLLLVEDRELLRVRLRQALKRQGYSVTEARDEPSAVRALRQDYVGLVLCDLCLPTGDGFGVLRAAKAVDPELPVIVLTAGGSIHDAVAAMKEGALDCLAEPIKPDDLLAIVDRAMVQRCPVIDDSAVREFASGGRMPVIVGQSQAMRQALVALRRVAPTEATVLLQGETGTGKALFAHALHALSPRANRPLVSVNCAGIPDMLFESELFGQGTAAAAGTVTRKRGRFDMADRGTLFLDHIGDLPLSLQPRILRALEEHSHEGAAGITSPRVDIRIVAATSKNLTEAVATRHFREDLFFRVSAFPITIPPLRDRPDDVAILAGHFVDRLCKNLKKSPPVLEPVSLRTLQAYPWPGNVRELQNCIECAVILADGGTIHPRHLKLSFATRDSESVSPWNQIDLTGTLSEASKRVLIEVERRKIECALTETFGNKVQAAEILRVSYKTLLMKLKKYGIG